MRLLIHLLADYVRVGGYLQSFTLARVGGGALRCHRARPTSKGAPVLARISSTVTALPGCSSVRTSPPPFFTSNTQRSVMMRLTTFKPVIGSVHSFKIFGL